MINRSRATYSVHMSLHIYILGELAWVPVQTQLIAG